MALTLPELRAELGVLGYGAVPDEVIFSSLSEMQLDIPSFVDDLSSSRPDFRGGKFSRHLHGSPVPGDRDYAKPVKSTVARGGLDSVCFTSDFATELDEMRKMLRIMEGTKEELFGSLQTPKGPGKIMGLADEHEQYIGNLFGQWRTVGRTLRTKRKGNCVAGGEISEYSPGAVPPDSRNWKGHFEEQDTDPGTPLSVSVRSTEPEVPDELDICDLRADYANICESEAERLKLEEESGQVDESLNGKVEGRDHAEKDPASGTVINAEEEEISEPNCRKAIVVEGNDKGVSFRRETSSSEISPGASYKQGGMLYPENFIDLIKYPEVHSNGEVLALHHDPEATPPPSPPSSSRTSNHDPEQNPSSALPSPAHTPKAMLDNLSSLSNDKFLAAFERSVQALDPQDTIDQESFANVNPKSTGSTAHPTVISGGRPVETENPLDSNHPVSRTADPRTGGHQSPLNDRSNIHTAEFAVHSHRRAKPVFSITEFNSPVSLKRSQSSRDSRRTEKPESNGKGNHHFPSTTEDGVDSHPSVKTTPPPSARKIRSEKVLHHSLSEKNPKITFRNKGGSDVSHLDIPELGLSPIKVREPASPLKLPTRERLCGAYGLSEHRHSTCTVCPAARKSSDSHSHGFTGSRSPFGKNVEGAPVGTVVSPKQKFPLRKGPGPSGIYTPLIDKKKSDINSKVLLKTSRLSSSMDFSSESSRATNRRVSSLRSSTESSRSSGPHDTTSSQDFKSNSGSAPFVISSSSPSFDSKDKLTPGGPRGGGKVDRVARFAEMQNLWKNDKFLKASSKRKPESFHRIFAHLHLSHERYTAAYRERVLEDMRPPNEAPPFVVPTVYSSSELVKSPRAFL